MTSEEANVVTLFFDLKAAYFSAKRSFHIPERVRIIRHLRHSIEELGDLYPDSGGFIRQWLAEHPCEHDWCAFNFSHSTEVCGECGKLRDTSLVTNGETNGL